MVTQDRAAFPSGVGVRQLAGSPAQCSDDAMGEGRDCEERFGQSPWGSGRTVADHDIHHPLGAGRFLDTRGEEGDGRAAVRLPARERGARHSAGDCSTRQRAIQQGFPVPGDGVIQNGRPERAGKAGIPVQSWIPGSGHLVDALDGEIGSRRPKLLSIA